MSPDRAGDDSVPVGIGVVAEGDVELVFELDETGHRKGARAVHADLAVVVQRHEPERGIDRRVGDGDIEAVPIGDRLPVMDGRAAQGVDAELEARRLESPSCR